MSDSADDKIYAYDLANRDRQANKDIDLHNNNADPGGIWSDGKTVWVMDIEDKHAYAYSLKNGHRKRFQEFWTVPDNDDPSGGLTGHGLRFWVADSDDEKVYAYGKLNTPPPSARPPRATKFIASSQRASISVRFLRLLTPTGILSPTC